MTGIAQVICSIIGGLFGLTMGLAFVALRHEPGTLEEMFALLAITFLTLAGNAIGCVIGTHIKEARNVK